MQTILLFFVQIICTIEYFFVNLRQNLKIILNTYIMKRLFTLIAAMGCAVGMMMADTFSDGNYVKIGSTGMTDETGISGITGRC